MSERFEIDYEKLADTIYGIACRAWRQQTLLPMYADQLRAAFRISDEPPPAKDAEPVYETAEAFVQMFTKSFWAIDEMEPEGFRRLLSKHLSRYRPCDRDAVIEECALVVDCAKVPDDGGIGLTHIPTRQYAAAAVRALKGKA